MAGFKPNRKLYTLDFSGTDLDGLIVKAGTVSLGSMLELQELGETLKDDPKANQSTGTIRQMVSIFMSALREWNLLDEDDQLVPTTIEGALTQDVDLVMEIIKVWTTAVSGVSGPLDASSPSGRNALEAAMPMEVLSLSQVN